MDLDKILAELDGAIKKDVAEINKDAFEAIKNAKMTSELRKDLKTKQRYRPPRKKSDPNHTRGR